MKVIEMTGKTVEEALKNALAELKVTEDRIDIEVLDAGAKGFFNLIEVSGFFTFLCFFIEAQDFVDNLYV